MKTKCSKCGQSLEFDAEHIGEIAECPTCKHQFKISEKWKDYINHGKALPNCYKVCEQCCNISSPIEKWSGCGFSAMIICMLLFIMPISFFILSVFGPILIVAVIAGLMIYRFCFQPDYKCSSCGSHRMVPMDSPKGKEIIENYNLSTKFK